MSEYSVYAATVRQMNGVIAERDALAAALAAKTEQVAGLLDERQVLRAQRARWRDRRQSPRRAHTDAHDMAPTCSQRIDIQLAGGSNAKTGWWGYLDTLGKSLLQNRWPTDRLALLIAFALSDGRGAEARSGTVKHRR